MRKNQKYYQLETQQYLKTNKLSTRNKKSLFKFRTRMVNVGHNFGNKIKCPLCQQEDDTQKHLFQCFVMKLSCKEIYHMQGNYEDIFNSKEDYLISIAKVCERAIKTREELLD